MSQTQSTAYCQDVHIICLGHPPGPHIVSTALMLSCCLTRLRVPLGQLIKSSSQYQLNGCRSQFSKLSLLGVLAEEWASDLCWWGRFGVDIGKNVGLLVTKSKYNWEQAWTRLQKISEMTSSSQSVNRRSRKIDVTIHNFFLHWGHFTVSFPAMIWKF